MKYSKQVWDQLKNLTAGRLANALRKDNWEEDAHGGSQIIFRKPPNLRCSVHMHPGTTYGEKLLKSILEDIGWTEEQLRKLGLIK